MYISRVTRSASPSPAPASVRPSPSIRAWRNGVFAIFWLEGFVFASWASRIPQVRSLLDASTAEMGVLLGAIAVGAVSGLLASSHIIGRLGATRTILIFYSAAAVGVLAAAIVLTVAPSFAALLVALLVFGAGQSIVDVAMNLSGAANERALGRTILPLFHAAFSLGTVMGAALGSLLLLLVVPIGAHLGAVGAMAILVTALLVRHLRPAGQDPVDDAGEKPGRRSRLAVWTDPRVLLVGLIVLGMAFAEGSANDWLGLSMVDGYDVDPAAGAAIFAIFVAALTVARIAGVRVLDRFGRVAVLRASAVLAAVGLLLVVFGQILPVAIAGTVLWGLGAALGFPVGISAAADDPRTATAAVSAVATIGYCAFLIGPPLIGFVGEHLGLLNALLIVLVLTAIAGVASGAAKQNTAEPPSRTL